MSLPHLILGLLHRKSDSGYDLNKRFERTVAHFWSTDQSQIYRTLYKLLDKGWVEVETVIQADNPNKKVYHLTEAGRQALVNWLQKPIEGELVLRDGATGQIYFGDALDSDQLINVQQQYIQRLSEKVATYHTIEQEVFIGIDFDVYPLGMSLAHATLQYGIRVLQMQIEWRKEIIERVKQHQQSIDKGEK